MRLSRWILAALLPMLVSGANAQAEPFGQREARQMLFAPRGAVLQEVEGVLSGDEAVILDRMLQAISGEGLANYYGAVAVSPDFFVLGRSNPGTAALSGLLQVTERLHSPQRAAQTALDACRDAAASRGAAQCAIVAYIIPRGYAARDLTMSVAATEAFQDYRSARAPKAFALSPRSQAFAAAQGTTAEAEALAACNRGAARTGQPDCKIVVRD